MEKLSIYLLGSFMISLGDRVVSSAFRTKKEKALIAYLAVESRQRHRRESLAELLWPGRPEGYARTNLRQALLGVRKVIGADHLVVTDEYVQLKRGASTWLDVNAFRQLYLSTQSHPHERLNRCRECAARLQEAVELYRGDLFEEICLADAQEYQEWCVFQREQSMRYLLAALQELSDYFEVQGDYESAQQYARRYVSLAPLEEAAHRRLMSALAQSGKRSAALEQFHTCRKLLARELSVEPTEETVRLYEMIRTGALVGTASAPPPPPHNLPAELTSFYGRESEIEQLQESLVNPECRLITLVGMPGAGKTRLALHVARQKLDRYPDGAWLVRLGEGTRGQSLAERILFEQGVTVLLGMPPAEQLLNRLQGMRLLLILDSFEDYIAETSFLIEILRVAPGVKILLTTQQRLNYQSACVIQVRGLPYTGDEQSPDTMQQPAMQLFLSRASHSRTGFAATRRNVSDILVILRLVDGLPLGIELAAAALRESTPNEIVQGMNVGLGMLKTTMEDLPEVHRSMRNAIGRAWMRLPLEDQALLVDLAGRPGEIHTRDAGASMDRLASLVSASLLEAGSPGVYSLHPLVRSYALEWGQKHSTARGNGSKDRAGGGKFWDSLERMIAKAGQARQIGAVVLLALESDHPLMGNQDQLNKEAVGRIAAYLRKTDVVDILDSGLIGVVLEDLSAARNSLAVAKKICGALNEPFKVLGGSVVPVSRMGISVYPQDASDARGLYEKASAALRKAQQSGTCWQLYGEEITAGEGA